MAGAAVGPGCARHEPAAQPAPVAPPPEKKPCAEGMALVSASQSLRFCVDRWEGSLVEVLADSERAFSPYESPQGRTVRAVTGEGRVPQGYISRDQAEAACSASHKRLCAEEEWVSACKGDPPHVFPYGDSRLPGACNDSGLSPLRLLYADSPDMYGGKAMNDPRLNQQPNTLATAGAFPRCTNAYGVFDMVGNLHEWVMSRRSTFRGGYYLDTHLNGDGCSYKTTAHQPSYHDYSTGFRCCADPL
jgi:formylglycine-generating enzyme required for sulfatase activity